jgi:hypothetical protein
MIRRLVRAPVAVLMRFVMNRPQLKARVRAALARSPLLTTLMLRLTQQSSYRPPAARRAPGAMTPRSKRMLQALQKARQARLD